MSEKKDLVEKDKNEVAPISRVSGDKGHPAGYDNMDMEQDVQMPRIAILQGLSQLVTDGKGSPGQIANAITKEIYGTELIFIPLFLFKTRARFEIGQGLICMSRDALYCAYCNCPENHGIDADCLRCEQAKWPDKKTTPDASGPDCSLVYNYPVLNTKNLNQFPVSLSLMRTATKAAKSLNSILVYTGEDFFSSKIRMTIKKEEGSKGVYFTPMFEMAGRTTDEEYAIAKKWYTTLRHKTIDVDLQAEAPFDNNSDTSSEVPF